MTPLENITIPMRNNSSNMRINEWIKNPVMREQLLTISDKLTKEHHIEFYTDGSFIISNITNTLSHYKADTVSCSMGAGFYAISLTGPVTFKAQVVDYPSSTRAELAAIEFALLTVPYNCIASIFTDSQAAIDGIHKFRKVSDRRKATIHNWIPIARICSLCKEKSINLNLIKIKAHSDIAGNDMADELAKQGLSGEYNSNNNIVVMNSPFQFYPTFNSIPIDIGIRKFVVRTLNAYNDIEWSLLQNIQDLCHLNNTTIDWTVTWILFHQCKGFRCISSHRNYLWSFLFKLLHKSLPLCDTLSVRRLDLYIDMKCPMCKND